jgi:hypothetical protein
MMASLRSSSLLLVLRLLLLFVTAIRINDAAASFVVPNRRPAAHDAAAWSSRPRRTTTGTGTGTTSTILYGVQDREKMLREEIEQRNNRIQNEKKYAVADGELLVEQLTSSLDSIEGLATVTSAVRTAPTAVGAVVKEEQGQIDNDDDDDDDAGTVVMAAATSTATLERPVVAVVAAVPEVTSSSSSSSAISSTSSPFSAVAPLEATKTGLAARMERLTKPRAYPLFLAEKAAEIVEATVHDVATMLLQGSSDSSKMMSSSSLEDDSGSTSSDKRTKERIVILGTGWGAAAFLKAIDTDIYHVTVVR